MRRFDVHDTQTSTAQRVDYKARGRKQYRHSIYLGTIEAPNAADALVKAWEMFPQRIRDHLDVTEEPKAP